MSERDRLVVIRTGVCVCVGGGGSDGLVKESRVAMVVNER